MGARAGMDGLHTMSFPANSSNIPVEVLESVAPVRVRRTYVRTPAEPDATAAAPDRYSSSRASRRARSSRAPSTASSTPRRGGCAAVVKDWASGIRSTAPRWPTSCRSCSGMAT